MNISKICCRCKIEKLQSEFYRDSRRKDSRYPACKACCKIDEQARKQARKIYYQNYNQIPDKKERRQAVQKEYRSRTEHKEKRKLYPSTLNRVLDPVKVKAYSKLNNTVRDGKIKREPCSVCGCDVRIEGHHEDYEKPLDVIWLCPKHHKESHLSG